MPPLGEIKNKNMKIREKIFLTLGVTLIVLVFLYITYALEVAYCNSIPDLIQKQEMRITELQNAMTNVTYQSTEQFLEDKNEIVKCEKEIERLQGESAPELLEGDSAGRVIVLVFFWIGVFYMIWFYKGKE